MKLVEITPNELRCGVGMCPAVFKDNEGGVLIIGRLLTSGEVQALELEPRIGADEAVVRIDASFLKGLQI